jgi:hypothetical protein
MPGKPLDADARTESAPAPDAPGAGARDSRDMIHEGLARRRAHARTLNERNGRWRCFFGIAPTDRSIGVWSVPPGTGFSGSETRGEYLETRIRERGSRGGRDDRGPRSGRDDRGRWRKLFLSGHREQKWWRTGSETGRGRSGRVKQAVGIGAMQGFCPGQRRTEAVCPVGRVGLRGRPRFARPWSTGETSRTGRLRAGRRCTGQARTALAKVARTPARVAPKKTAPTRKEHGAWQARSTRSS